MQGHGWSEAMQLNTYTNIKLMSNSDISDFLHAQEKAQEFINYTARAEMGYGGILEEAGMYGFEGFGE